MQKEKCFGYDASIKIIMAANGFKGYSDKSLYKPLN